MHSPSRDSQAGLLKSNRHADIGPVDKDIVHDGEHGAVIGATAKIFGGVACQAV
jgi:hypothetical protein